MNEAMTRKTMIDTILVQKGWMCGVSPSVRSRWEEEFPVAAGRIGRDARHHNPKRADYVFFVGRERVAVLEAKRDTRSEDEAEAQAKFYAGALGIRLAYATNGRRLVEFDLHTGASRELRMDDFPDPESLLAWATAVSRTGLEEACAQVPYSRAGGRVPRYYQERAVEAVIAKLGAGERRILLNLATGTGKTFIAFQICHKLIGAKWQKANLGVEKPHILFLTDRNILASQAFDDFHFPEGDCFRYMPGVELKLTRYIYFTLYQMLMGENYDETKYQQFPRDFFDLVIVDECHRGVSGDESRWKQILNYFDCAAHLGLTATPRCDENGETYAYFGRPAYVYSLRQGIEDGFLSPYEVMRCRSTLERYHVEEGDVISFPDAIDPNREYSGNELERRFIRVLARDRHFVDELFKVMPLKEKAIVFCVTQGHAHRIARLIAAEAARRGISTDPNYCVTVTSDTGEYGERQLRLFRKTSERIPTVLTTSQKLTTGVDASNLRSIVVFRNVNSSIEFKQIVGRGTRVCEGKAGFVIYDFVGATEHMRRDDFWDDDPKCPKCGCNPCVCEPGGGHGGGGGNPGGGQGGERHEIDIQLGSGRVIAAEWTREIVFDGELISVEEFMARFIRAVKAAAADPSALRAQWQTTDSRTAFLATLDAQGFTEDRLKDIQAALLQQNYDMFDVILELAYAVEPVTRELRAQRVRDSLAHVSIFGAQREFAELILRNYVANGVWTLTRGALADLLKARYRSLQEAKQALQLPSMEAIFDFYSDVQRRLYAA